jgi:hypothetical protein
MRSVDAVARKRSLLFVTRGGGSSDGSGNRRDRKTRGENRDAYFE